MKPGFFDDINKYYIYIIVGIIAIGLIVGIGITVYKHTSKEGFENTNELPKYMILPINFNKMDIYNYPTTNINSVPYSLDTANSFYDNGLKEDYIKTLLNTVAFNSSGDLMIDEAYLIPDDTDIDSLENMKYYKSLDNNTFEYDNVTQFNKCVGSNMNLSCNYLSQSGNGIAENVSISKLVLIKFNEDKSASEIGDYLKMMKKYIAERHMKYAMPEGEELISTEVNNYEFNIVLTDEAKNKLISKPEVVNVSNYIPTLHNYFLTFVKIPKQITKNGLKVFNINNYNKVSAQYLNDDDNLAKFTDNLSSYITSNLFSLGTNKILSITLADSKILEEINSQINDKEIGSYFHQYKIKTLSSCLFNAVYDKENSSFINAKINLGVSNEYSNSTNNTCGDFTKVLSTDKFAKTTDADKAIEAAGGDYFNVPVLISIGGTVGSVENTFVRGYNLNNPGYYFLDNNDSAVQSKRPLLIKNTAKIDELLDDVDEKLKMVVNSGLDRPIYRAPANINYSSGSNNEPAAVAEDNEPVAVAEDNEPVAVAEDNEPAVAEDNEPVEDNEPAAVAEDNEPVAAEDNEPVAVAENTPVQQGVLTDINGNPINYGVTENPYACSDGDCVSYDANNIGAIELQAAVNAKREMDKYYVPSETASRGNINISDFEGNLNIFYPNVVSY